MPINFERFFKGVNKCNAQIVGLKCFGSIAITENKLEQKKIDESKERKIYTLLYKMSVLK